VLTVVQESKRKDFGELGFHQYPGALYFIFPKPLPSDEGKVIGIKYDLVDSAKPADVISPAELKREAKKNRAKSPESKKVQPVVKTFEVLARRVAVLEESFSIDGHSKSEARQKAAETLKTRGFDLGNAKIENEIKSVK